MTKDKPISNGNGIIINSSGNGSGKDAPKKNGSSNQSLFTRCPFCNLRLAPADIKAIIAVRFSDSTDQVNFHLGCSPGTGIGLTKEQLLDFMTISSGKVLGPLYLTDYEYENLRKLIKNMQEKIEEKDKDEEKRILKMRSSKIFKLLMQLIKSRVKEGEILGLLLQKFSKSSEISQALSGVPIAAVEGEISRLQLKTSPQDLGAAQLLA